MEDKKGQVQLKKKKKLFSGYTFISVTELQAHTRLLS